MSFSQAPVDLSTLPKVKTYANLGQSFDCSIWNPLTYPTCATWIIQARTELADAHNQILSLANLWQQTIADINDWPDSLAKSNALAEAQSNSVSAIELVQEHTQVQNDFETKVQPFKAIGLAGLGIIPVAVVPPWLIISAGSLIVSALLAWGITSALALKSNYDSKVAFYNQFVEYYKTCQELSKQGKPCDVTGPSTSSPGGAWGSSAVTWTVLIGLGALVLFNVIRR